MRQPKPFFRKQTQTYYVQLDGKQINLGPDKEEAWKTYYEMMAGRRKVAPSGSVAQLLEKYWAWCKRHQAKTTVDGKKATLKSFRLWIGTLPISRLKPHHVYEWVEERHADNNPTTVNTKMTVLKAFSRWCLKMGYIDRDPLILLEKPERKSREEFLTKEECDRLLSMLDGSFRDLIEFCIETGCRAQEVFVLEAKHIEGNKLVLERSISKGRKRRRVIWMNQKAQAIVARNAKEGPIFRNSKGRPWDHNSVKCRFSRLEKHFGKKVCLTQLRHSFAHHRLSSGQDAATVAALMGHVDTRMITSRYGHLEANEEYMLRAAEG